MSTIEPSAQVTFLTDDDGKVVTWNPACATLFGWTPEQAPRHALTELVAGEASWAALAAAGGGHLQLRMAGGHEGAATLTLLRQYDALGRPQGWSASILVAPSESPDESERVGNTPLARVVDLLPGTFYAINRAGRFVLWNDNLERLTELTPDELAAAQVMDMFEPRERALAAENIRRVFEEGAEVSMEVNYVSRSGRETPMMVGGALVACNGGSYLFGMGINIARRRDKERQLRLSERALHAASNGIVITRCTGSDNLIEYVNPAFEHIAGYTASESIGRDPRFMAAPEFDAYERSQVRIAVAERRAVNVVFRNKRKNGELFWNDLGITPVRDEYGEVTHFIGVLQDVTALKERADHLEHEVNHDALTGLANRTLLWDRLEHAVHLAQRHKTMVAVVLIDLNNFKTINDTFGHQAGDVVLKVVGRRLSAAVRDSDTVARMSGDEFVLVLVDQPSLRFTLRMAERLRRSLVMPVAFDGNEIPVGASLGVAICPHDGCTPAELVRAADMAMYQAKSNGGGVHFFSPEMRSASEKRAALTNRIRNALEHDELFLLFQPRMDARSGKVRGFEALLRWRHPEQGVMLPASFLSEAEESGQMIDIGNWVLDQACAFVHQLRQLGYTGLPVSVNVSYREYSQIGFIPGIAARMQQYGLPAGSLEIEIPEADLIRNPGLGRDLSAQLHDTGVSLSIDEFGKGISDLSFLRQLLVRQVKLSKSAVHDIVAEGNGSQLAKTLIDIGHNLELAVVGEAVETEAQVDFLRSHGCDQLQGQWFSEPLAAEAVHRMLDQRYHAQ
ncbi:sensor domain-containing protein [Massilia yuzhufengensis]|uniref:PAS domain S-box-containing protein/diguanylate cyclase (GGDEF) domain-containing protein n=1 Tax=Massilia yuzhufengensis TaxID=1164594 RepID=A0A1I1K5E5_9BURK|nr:EAL domain-containing protein [Massilia yuzhufengensis]SFC55741.1 PAS domain S-box-containing protein/diguanylate cyclase (GGDEF) domain-containing protein [Massilia yuzhufengensis]